MPTDLRHKFFRAMHVIEESVPKWAAKMIKVVYELEQMAIVREKNTKIMDKCKNDAKNFIPL
ncbi:MAG: hypothetical protein LKF31_04560 [Muribaculaceae bacterium]|jgi:hypothetical protein|nr:hypothetical protein [Muribaculaceae bacterium]